MAKLVGAVLFGVVLGALSACARVGPEVSRGLTPSTFVDQTPKRWLTRELRPFCPDRRTPATYDFADTAWQITKRAFSHPTAH